MYSLAIVEKFDVVEQIRIDFAEVTILSSIDSLLLQHSRLNCIRPF